MLDRSDPRKDAAAAKRPINWKPVEATSGREPKEPDEYGELASAGKRESIFNRWNQAFHDVLSTNRGPGRVRAATEEAGEDPGVSADDLAIRRARTVKLQRMVVPEGVIIEGSLTSGSETEISGRIEGDVNVEGRLHLGPSALVTGNVRATSCLVEGLVEGKVECAQELELGRTGRLNADAMGGKEVTLAGQVFGSVMTGGVARLRATAKISGNIRARRIVIEDVAVFNGTCTMRAPAQRAESAAARSQQQELRQIQHQQQQQGREEK